MIDRLETKEAALALIAWLRSQDLEPQEGLLVLVAALQAVVHGIARAEDLDQQEGLDHVAELIRAGI